MRLEFHFLDYIWKALLLGAMTASVFLIMMFCMSITFKKSNPLQTKWCLSLHYIFLLIALAGGLIFVSIGDPELVAGCFNNFVEKTSSSTLTRAVAGSWLAIFTVLLGIDAIRYFLARRRMGSIQMNVNPTVKEVVDDLRLKLGLGERAISLCSTPEVGSPFVYGLFHHQVVIPEKFLRSATEGSLRGAIAHELVHVRDFDSMWLALELLCRRILFFHPLVYLMSRVFLSNVERAADQEAIGKANIEPRVYVQSLILAASHGTDFHHLPLAMNVSSGFLETKSRIMAIGEFGSRRSRWWSGPLLMIAPVMSFGLSVAEAQTSVNKTRASEVMMCSQVAHEKIIESWLRIEPVSKKCE